MRGKIKANKGGGDFGPGFYTTRRIDEAIFWAELKARWAGGGPQVIALEVGEVAFNALKGKVGHPHRYEVDLLDAELLDYPLGHPDLPFDYIRGKVSVCPPEYEQITFKSQRAFELLNTSPRSIYRVLPSGELELTKRFVP